jgi:hypothetical protein
MQMEIKLVQRQQATVLTDAPVSLIQSVVSKQYRHGQAQTLLRTTYDATRTIKLGKI